MGQVPSSKSEDICIWCGEDHVAAACPNLSTARSVLSGPARLFHASARWVASLKRLSWHSIKVGALAMTALMVSFPPWHIVVHRNGASARMADGYHFFYSEQPLASINVERLLIQIALLWLVVWMAKLTVYRNRGD